MSMSPKQVADNRDKRLKLERTARNDQILLSRPKVKYSTWTGKPSRVLKEEK